MKTKILKTTFALPALLWVLATPAARAATSKVDSLGVLYVDEPASTPVLVIRQGDRGDAKFCALPANRGPLPPKDDREALLAYIEDNCLRFSNDIYGVSNHYFYDQQANRIRLVVSRTGTATRCSATQGIFALCSDANTLTVPLEGDGRSWHTQTPVIYTATRIFHESMDNPVVQSSKTTLFPYAAVVIRYPTIGE